MSKKTTQRKADESKPRTQSGAGDAIKLTIRAMKDGASRISFVGVTIAALFFATMTSSVPAAFAQPMPPGSEQRSMPGMDSPQTVGLAREIAQLRSRIVQIRAALHENYPGGTFEAGRLPVDVAMDDERKTSDAVSEPAMISEGIPTAAGCCSGMMGKMGVAGSALPTMPSGGRGFLGASHIFHVGASGFFLDYSGAIMLTADQQAALNRIKEKSIGDVAAAQRQIDQAEQKLWMLTSSDQPDSMALETKVRDIERLKSDQRIAFIRSVDEAARVLTDDQRAALHGTSAPRAAQMTAPQAPAGSVNQQGGTSSTAPKGGMAGMGDDDSMSDLGGDTPDTKSNNGETGDM